MAIVATACSVTEWALLRLGGDHKTTIAAITLIRRQKLRANLGLNVRLLRLRLWLLLRLRLRL